MGKSKITRREPPGKPSDLGFTIYGRSDGEFLIVRHDPGSTLPGEIGDGLELIGGVRELLRRAVRRRNQMRVADRVGIGRATFNNYVYQGGRPNLRPEIWRSLVQLAFNPPNGDEEEERRTWKQTEETNVPGG